MTSARLHSPVLLQAGEPAYDALAVLAKIVVAEEQARIEIERLKAVTGWPETHVDHVKEVEKRRALDVAPVEGVLAEIYARHPRPGDSRIEASGKLANTSSKIGLRTCAAGTPRPSGKVRASVRLEGRTPDCDRPRLGPPERRRGS